MRILLTNDDGLESPGLWHAARAMKSLGDIIISAPDREQSGNSSAISLNRPLRVERARSKIPNVAAYAVQGTPADCVKLAVNELMPRQPDLCVSGINHGSNSSINVIYSGTMSAAIEAGIEGIPAIGFSLLDNRWNADFSNSKKFIKKITLNALKNKIPKGVVLNVNIPAIKESEIKGIKICRQAKA